MSGSRIDHPLVLAYLRELDAALARLPAERASELREQITAHLDEALRSGAEDSDVVRTLGRLGSPADLVAEAGPAEPAATELLASLAHRARWRIARVHWWTWVIAAIVLALAGTGIGYLTAYLSVGGLQEGTSGGWWYAQDYNREVDTSADGAMQTTVPIRDGQQQGLALDLYNPTNFTQTVLGPAGGQYLGADSPGSQSATLSVSVPNRDIDMGGFNRQVRFTLPGSIPPHQERLLRVLWVSDVCLGQGDTEGINLLYLTVRVGWFTRTETVPLIQGWYLSGPSHGRCG